VRPPGPEQAEPSTTTKVRTPNIRTFKTHHLRVGSLESRLRTKVWASHRAYECSNDQMAPLFASRTARTATPCFDFRRTIHHVARSLFINPLTPRATHVLLNSSDRPRVGDLPGQTCSRAVSHPLGRVQGTASGLGQHLARSLAGAAMRTAAIMLDSTVKGFPFQPTR
jgi:hypothetical protein